MTPPIASICIGDPLTGVASANGGISSALNVSAATVVKASPGRLVRLSIITAGSTAGSAFDAASVGAGVAANQIVSIPTTATAGSVIFLDWPCLAGIVVTPGTSGVIAVAFV